MATLFIIAMILLVAAVATLAFSYFVGRRLRSRLQAIILGGLSVPVLIIASSAIYVSHWLEIDEAPGMILLGNFILAALLLPCTTILTLYSLRKARAFSPDVKND